MGLKFKLSILLSGQVQPQITEKINRYSLDSETEVIGPISGPAVAQMRNEGARIAQGQWLFFCDQDCDFNPHKVKQTISRIESMEKRPLSVGGRYQLEGGSLIDRAYDFIQRLWLLKGQNKNRRGGLVESSHIFGGCMLVPAEVFKKQKFCEKIGWGGEELHWVQNLQENHGVAMQSYRLAVTHHSNKTLGQFFRRAWIQGYNYGFWRLDSKGDSQVKGSKYIGFLYQQPLALTFLVLLFFTLGRFAMVCGRFHRAFA